MALLVASCAPQPGVQRPLFVGIEPVRNNDPLRLDLSARLLADLAALPNLRVIDLGALRNTYDFASLSASKLRLFVTLEPGAFCLRAGYTVAQSGQLRYVSGLVIPRAEAPDARGCVDLLATRLYGDLIRQGL
jgi:hypothetical protein